MSNNTPRLRWIKANGVKMRYAEVGNEGPVIVALHGGGAGSSGKSGMGSLLPLLGDDFWVVAPDSVGGYGETDVNAPAPLGLISRAIQMEAMVDAMGIEKLSIMGNSQGAFSAAYFAYRNPHLVDRIILVASGSIATAMGVKQEVTEALKALQGYDGTRDAMRRLLAALIIDPSKLTEELIDARQNAATRPGALDAFRRFSEAVKMVRSDPVLSLHMDMRTVLPALTKSKPTIFIWGEQDTFSVPSSGKQVEALLPDAKFHWIPGAGHQVQTDKPQEVANIIKAFVKRE